MTNFSQNEILQTLAGYEQSGDFVRAMQLLGELTEEVCVHPAVALQIVRLRTSQGDFNAAAQALRRADFSAASANEKLIGRLQEILIGIYQSVLDIETAGREAEAAFEKADKTVMTVVEVARAKHLLAQILLLGVIYSVLPDEKKRQAQKLLQEAVRDLENDGRVNEAFSLRLSYTDSMNEETEIRLAELGKLSREASAADNFGTAGKAFCTQALLMLQNAFPSEQIYQALEKAEKSFAASEHSYGLIDVRCVRAKLRIEREQSPPESLVPIIEQYRAIEYIRGELSVLMDVAQLFHENGNLNSALSFHDRVIELSEESGFLMFRYSADLRRAEVLVRNGKFSQAIDLSEAALSSPNIPLQAGATYRQVLGTAYSFVKNYKKSAFHFASAKEIFEKINLLDAVSNLTILQVNNLDSLRDDKAWQEAEKILPEWLERDEKRKAWELVIRHYELLAQIKFNQYSFSATRHSDDSLLDEMEEIIVRAEKLLPKLSGRQAALRSGSLHQMRGQLAVVRGNTFSLIDEWTRAAEAFQSAGFEMEASNCRYMLGVIFHNLANQQILPHALISQDALLKAAGYYEKTAMGMQAGDAHYLLASLYKNTIAALSAGALPDADYLIPKAFEHIQAAERSFDSIRRAYYSSDAFESQQDKQAIIEKSARLYQLGLDLYIWKTKDLSGAWHWMQRAKARGLTDNLAGSFAEPQKFLAEINKHPDALAIVQKEGELTARIRHAAADLIPALRRELSGLHELMLANPVLKDYFELRTGAAVDPEDLKAISDEEKESGNSCIFIDWVNIGRTLYLVCLRDGSEPQFVPLAIDLQTVRDFVQTHLREAGFRSTMRDNFELLDQLNPLVSPLETLSQPEELLVFSPTGILFVLPLHALKIGEQPLLARNPVIYEPSLSVLRHCYARRRKMSENPEVVIFGDPTSDRADALNAARELSERYRARLVTGQEVTKAAFIESSQKMDIVHFQGHARFNSVNPVDSHLLLADGQMNVRDIFSNLNLNAELVALTACESGVSEIKTGDEPLGLIPALLYAGSRSVLATLWRVNQKSAAEFTRLFYGNLYHSGNRPDRARALRKAVLELKDNENFSTPYHWAGYVLYGDWR